MKRALLLAVLVTAACTSPTKKTHRVFYPGGTLRWRQEVVQGVPHGRSETFYPSGTLKSAGTYHRGSKRGYFIFYTEDGTLERHMLFIDDAVLWESADKDERPPTALLSYIDGFGIDTLVRAEPAKPADNGPAATETLSKFLGATQSAFQEGDPSPRFSGLERVAGTTDLGMALGAGGAVEGSSLTRLSLYGHYKLDGVWDNQLGLYADFSTSRLSTMDASSGGRRTLEVAGTHRLDALGGTLSSRAGILAPMGNDTQFGAAISSASSAQRPTDSVAAMPSTVALRGGTSWFKSGSFWVIQGDAYLDIAVGGAADSVRPLGRLNGAIGLGGEKAMGALEVVNTYRLDDSEQSLRAVGASLRLQFSSVAASILLSRASGDRNTITGGISREF